MTIPGSVFAPTELMSEKDSMEAVCDGLFKAESAAKEYAKEYGYTEFEDMAKTLAAFQHGTKTLANMKAMSRFETLMAASLKANPKGFLNN